MLTASTLALVAAAGILATASTRGDSTASGCAHRRTLSVVVATELVPAVQKVSKSLPCLRVDVSAGDPSTVARQVARGEAPADVWIPDSSRWAAGLPFTSVAWSPVVLAAPSARLGEQGVPASFEGLAGAAAGGSPLVLTAPEPRRSATTQAALAQLDQALSTTPTLRGQLAAMLREMRAEEGTQTSRDVSVRATTEQGVWARNARAGGERLRAVYPPAGGLSLDYPVVVTAKRAAARGDAHTLTAALTSPMGVSAVEELGFRAPTGRANPRLTSSAGVDGPSGTDAVPLTPREAASALRMHAKLRAPTRALALVDVSGSMAASVPGTRSVSRIALARSALRGALDLFPTGTVAGLWRFSSDLTPSTNYEQLMPLTTLTARSRRDLVAAVDRLAAVPNGGTGLYDSVLAAVRYVRSGYDEGRVNSVIVLSDGKNEYASAHGITKGHLLAALRNETAASEHAVPVISIAYGPDSDLEALRDISTATGGAVYTARNPRDLPVIFRDAIGQRVCGSAC